MTLQVPGVAASGIRKVNLAGMSGAAVGEGDHGAITPGFGSGFSGKSSGHVTAGKSGLPPPAPVSTRIAPNSKTGVI